MSYVDLLVSIELWKGVHDNSEKRLPTVSAIFAAGSEENLRSFLAASESKENFEGIVQFWLLSLQKVKKQSRRTRKSLVKMGPPCDDVSSNFKEKMQGAEQRQKTSSELFSEKVA